MSHTEHCKHLKLLPLSFRREIADFVFVYKHLNRLMGVNFNYQVESAAIVGHHEPRTMPQTVNLNYNVPVRTEHFVFLFHTNCETME